MTIALHPSPAAGPVPVAEAVARVHEVLDAVDAGPVGSVSGRDVADVDRAIARLEAVKLRLVAAADREDAAAGAGMAGTAAWLAATTRSWGAKASADVALATALEEDLPVTRDALAAGQVSAAHAGVIAGAASRLPGSLTPAERTRIETALVVQARHLDPPRLRRAARRALLAAERTAAESAAHEDGELRGEQARAEARVRLTMHDNHDGTITGHFTVPALAGAILRKVIQQIAAPRRQGGAPGRPGHPDAPAFTRPPGTAHASGATAPSGTAAPSLHPASSGSDRDAGPSVGSGSPSATVPSGTAAPSGPGPHLSVATMTRHVDWPQRYGAAFVELLEHLPTDRLHGKVAATVVVTIDHDQLRANLGAAHLDTGHDLSASETRRLACSAGILPAVLDGTSLPLDLGRTNRFFSHAQRIALATTYDECASHGCDRPYAWSELHHQDPWAAGGPTNLASAVPLCRFHHQRAHDPTYDHHIRTDPTGRKTVTYHRRP